MPVEITKLRGDKDFGANYVQLSKAMTDLPAEWQRRFATIVLGAALHYLRLHEVKACIDTAIAQLMKERKENESVS